MKFFLKDKLNAIGVILGPDISIWDNDKVIGIIECKTNLGWNRIRREDDFILKEYERI